MYLHRKILGIGLALAIVFNSRLNGQVTIPAAYPAGTLVNYVRVWEAKAPIQDPADLVNRSVQDVNKTTQYYDGLGRLIQTVGWQTSPTGKDMVSAVVYDAFGREQYKYLPFVSNVAQAGDVTNDGVFKLDPFQQQSAFSAAQYPGETYYYSQVNYESSPLNRVQSTTAPGNSWAGAGKGVGSQYLVNTTDDSVRVWTIAMTGGSLPVSNGVYGTGQLYKSVTTDEQLHQVVEYKDKDGQVILKKVQLAGTPSVGHVGWLNTYYVYDNLDNLRFVLQPKAVELVNTNGTWTVSQAIANELCFRYEYDQRKRMIIKKVPGADEVWMVYDARDRVVMSQDANRRSQHQWLYTQYDNLNRPITSGILTDNTNYNNLSYHLAQAYTSSSYPNLGNYPTSELSKTFYDNYSWTCCYGVPFNGNRDTGADPYFPSPSNTVYPYPQPLQQSFQVKGLVTGTMERIEGGSGSSSYMYNATYYDDYNRVIQQHKENSGYWVNLVTIQPDFTGKPLQTYSYVWNNYTIPQGASTKTNFVYDNNGRLLTLSNNLSNTSDKTVATNSYNELGQLQSKSLGSNLESLTYEYNIRGWLTAINKTYVGGTSTHYFGMELGYDKQSSIAGFNYATPAYNGNISGTAWKSAGDGVVRKYDFNYDNVNRLMGARYQDNKNGAWGVEKMDFSVNNLGYDANGNILSMEQKGFKVGSPSSPIDQLRYSYQSNSNKLSQVMDTANDQNSKLGDFHYNPTNKGSADYSYDGNGNLIQDKNKGIRAIIYNQLNLPDTIRFVTDAGASKGNIIYTYDGAGNKLVKTVTDSSVTPVKISKTVYINGFEYVNDTLQFIGGEEGRMRRAYHKYLNGSTAYGWEYDYFLRDHLGNTRTVLTEQKDTAQYIATMEAAYRNTENLLFYNLPATNVARASVGYPADLSVTNPNDSVAQVNGSGQKVGPAIILKVMSGDKVDIGTNYYYTNVGTNGGQKLDPSDLLNSLASGIVKVSGGLHGSFSDLTASPSGLSGALSSFITNNNGTQAGKPNAYLNWVLLDNQFGYVGSNGQSGAIPVGNAGTTSGGGLQSPLAQSGIQIKTSGYLYIYVSNATPGWNVFFDNLSVKLYSGPMVEETHYYPFGLTMAGISDKALKTNYAENKYRYNKGSELQNKEFSDGSGLELYSTEFRSLDPQLGRWWQIDPKPDYAQSPYAAMDNNPILHNDPLGDTVIIRYTSGGKSTEAVYSGNSLHGRHGGDAPKDDDKYSKQVKDDLNGIKSFGDKKTNSKIATLEKSKQLHYIEMTDPGEHNGNSPTSSENDKKGIPTGSTTKFDPDATTTVSGDKRDPKVGLAHEFLGHGYDSDQGKSNYSKTSNGIPMYEVSAVNAENRVRAHTGDPQRTTYGGKPIPANLLEDPTKTKNP